MPRCIVSTRGARFGGARRQAGLESCEARAAYATLVHHRLDISVPRRDEHDTHRAAPREHVLDETAGAQRARRTMHRRRDERYGPILHSQASLKFPGAWGHAAAHGGTVAPR